MKRLIITVGISLIIAIFLTIILKIFFIQLYTYESDTMCKSVIHGSKLIISKVSRINNNDIVLCNDPKSGHFFLSRIVGSEDDKVTISEQNLYVNDKLTEYEYQTKRFCLRYLKPKEVELLKIKYKIKPYNHSNFYVADLTKSEFKEIINDSTSNLRKMIYPFHKCNNNIFHSEEKIEEQFISKDSFFVLNDNRSNLNDSRSKGLIHKSQIIGKLIYRY